MGPDLKHAGWIYLEALCFLLIVLVSAGLLLAQSFDLRTLLLVALLIWASARSYYFCFFVLEKYTDPSFRFEGLTSVLRHVVSRSRGQ